MTPKVCCRSPRATCCARRWCCLPPSSPTCGRRLPTTWTVIRRSSPRRLTSTRSSSAAIRRKRKSASTSCRAARRSSTPRCATPPPGVQRCWRSCRNLRRRVGVAPQSASARSAPVARRVEALAILAAAGAGRRSRAGGHRHTALAEARLRHRAQRAAAEGARNAGRGVRCIAHRARDQGRRLQFRAGEEIRVSERLSRDRRGEPGASRRHLAHADGNEDRLPRARKTSASCSCAASPPTRAGWCSWFEESTLFAQTAPRSPTTKIQPGPGEIFDLGAQVKPLAAPAQVALLGADKSADAVGNVAVPAPTAATDRARGRPRRPRRPQPRLRPGPRRRRRKRGRTRPAPSSPAPPPAGARQLARLHERRRPPRLWRPPRLPPSRRDGPGRRRATDNGREGAGPAAGRRSGSLAIGDVHPHGTACRRGAAGAFDWCSPARRRIARTGAFRQERERMEPKP